MISLGRRDARKELGLGFVGGGEMEDTELEEGEACLYHNNHNDDDYDATVNPDIALSYLDEKLQDVLGHCQKDFEGGVSAENLGAKFGGYGSFLPAYQQSPVWSQSRASPNVWHHNGPRSPNLHLEGGRCNSVSSSNAPQSVKLESASSNAVLLPASNALSSLIDSAKEVCAPLTCSAEEHTYRSKSVNRKSANLPDQNMLKFRIKVGSDNLSMRNNDAIYSGLGLDVSPSSSLDESPSESEGMSHEPQDTFIESPSHILQTMISFPVHGGQMLSPLPDDLIHFTEKEKIPKEIGSLLSGIVVNGSDSVKGGRKMIGEKKVKSLQRSEILATKSENNKGFRSSSDVMSKETNVDTLACEELVSNTLKLPLLSNSYSTVSKTKKSTDRASYTAKEVHKDVVRDEGFSNVIKEESLMPSLIHENGQIEYSNATSAGKVREDKKACSSDTGSIHPRKDSHRKEEKPSELVKIDSNASKGGKAVNSEGPDIPKQKVNEKAMSHDQQGMMMPRKKCSSENKKKIKGSQSNGNVIAEVQKESIGTGSSVIPKNKNSTNADGHVTKGELEDFKLQENSGKTGDMYREFFGDMELDEEESRMSPLGTSSEDRLKDINVSGKNASGSNMLKERSIGKRIGKVSTSEAYPKAASVAGRTSFAGNGSISDAAASAATAPIMIEENWVQCDKCQTWRLLPLGKNPNDLPEKWLCSMLDWLPDMNRCNYSEEETTNALMAYYQIPLQSQNNVNGNADGIAFKTTLADVQQLGKNHQYFGLHAMTAGGKMKHHSKELSNIACKDGLTQLSNSIKKGMQASSTNGSLNDINRSSMASDPDFLNPSNSIDLALEEHKHRQKEKHEILGNCSAGGDAKRSKMKGKRESDQDSFRISKKIKNEGLGEDWISDHGGSIEKIGPCSSNGLPPLSSGKNLPKYSDLTSSKDSKYDGKDQKKVSSTKKKEEVQVSLDDGSMDKMMHDGKGVAKKRKVKDIQDDQIYPSSLSNTGHRLQDGRTFMKVEFTENDHRKEKKATVSRSEGKESSASKGSGRTDKKGSHRKNKQIGQDLENTVALHSLDDVDSLKRGSRSLHSSVAATSSSSKVSGSHKSKGNYHDAKGSPVESVSSSPLRVSRPYMLTSARMNLTNKDDSIVAGFVQGGPRRCSDGEGDGESDQSGPSGTARKEKTFNVGHHDSLESSLLDFQENTLVSGHKTKVQIVPSSDITNHHLTKGSSDYLGQETSCPSKSLFLDQHNDDEKSNENHYHVSGSHPRKSEKGSSSRLKDKCRKLDSTKVKISHCINDQTALYEIHGTDGKDKTEEKAGVKSVENENRHVGKKDPGVLMLSESRNTDFQSNSGGHGGPDVKADASGSHDTTSSQKHGGKTVSGREKSQSLAPPEGSQNEILTHGGQPVSTMHRGNGTNILAANASIGDNTSKVSKHIRKGDHPNGIHHSSSRSFSSNGHTVRDLDVRSPVKRDSSSQAANSAVKEAKNLKHLADRVKHSGSNAESTKLYFEAALKFLHGASLLETCSSENARTGEMIQSMQIYSSTAKLCEFCAHEYEKLKDMGAAALAYKCMEVAYMRVIYSSNTNANRDRHELQMALQMVPPGESPSSSASDIDNLNNPTTVDKAPITKGVSSPQVTGSHVIAARNRPNFVRLLNFAQDVNFVMEASKKSRAAFAAANVSLRESQNREGISSIKTALDFNFQDVEGLLRLVRLAIEAISR